MMNAKEYLSQIGILDARLRVIDSNIEKLRRDLRGMYEIELSSSWPDGQPHGTILTDPTGTKATKLADRHSERRKQLIKKLQDYEYQQIMVRSKLWSKRMEATEKMSKILEVDDVMSKVYYNLLTMRYVDGASWEEIAVSIGYTWRHTIRLHGEALKRMEAILNE